MSEMPAQAPAQMPARLAPHAYRPGENGRERRSKRYIEICNQITAELGDNISALDRVMVEQITNLMVTAERPGVVANDRVRCTNTAARLLRGLRAKYVKSKAAPSLASYRRKQAEAVS